MSFSKATSLPAPGPGFGGTWGGGGSLENEGFRSLISCS